MEESRIGLVVMLLREGSFLDAVNVYQEEAGVSFRAAKRNVRELRADHSIAIRRISLVPLLLIALAGLLGVLLSH